MEGLLLFWVLPSLVTFLIFTVIGRCDGKPIETWTPDECRGIVVGALIYPWGLWLLLYFYIIEPKFKVTWDSLTKERQWKIKKK